MKTFYYRNLPHIQHEEGIFFITFRLVHSLPQDVVREIQKQYIQKCKVLERRVSTDLQKQELYKEQKRYFAKIDTYLDKACSGNTWLKEKEIAQMVADATSFRDKKQYNLIAYCIMPNHVHLLIRFDDVCNANALLSDYQSELPDRQLFHVLHSLKRFTARQCNRILNRQGEFWQKESYDHYVRSHNELQNIIAYILQNPVKSGLAAN